MRRDFDEALQARADARLGAPWANGGAADTRPACVVCTWPRAQRGDTGADWCDCTRAQYAAHWRTTPAKR